jgi:hypothetical protein
MRSSGGNVADERLTIEVEMRTQCRMQKIRATAAVSMLENRRIGIKRIRLNLKPIKMNFN